MSNLRKQWPRALHAAYAVESVWPERSGELSVLCKRIPVFFARDGLLTALTFALSRDGGAQYVRLLSDVVRVRIPTVAESPKELIQALSRCDSAHYQLVSREFIESAQAVRYAADALSDGSDDQGSDGQGSDDQGSDGQERRGVK